MIPFYESVNGGPPEPITALSPVAWYRYGVGITVTGQGVSTWADQSGNGNDLLQGTDGARPPLQADNSILFNGTDEYLKAVGFTLNQPETVYGLGRQITWTSNDHWFDGNAAISGRVVQLGTTPAIIMSAGSSVASNINAILNTYCVVAAVFNGASSELQVNRTTTTTGDAGAANMGGFTLAARGDNAVFSNIQVKEVIVFPDAHDAATRAIVITYLATVGGVNL